MLFQNKCLLISFCLFVCALLFAAGCKQKSSSSLDYDLGKPEVTLLGNVLNEISGICYYDNPGDSALLAVVDSKERIFKLDMKVPKLIDYTEKVLLPNSDPEDVIKVDTSIFVLLSRGVIKEIPDKAKDTVGVKTYVLPLAGVNDFESLYYDPSANGVIMLCKACENEKGGGVRTAYRFNLSTKTFDTSAFYTIDKNDIKAILKDAGAKFDPSAAAIHPVNKRLYVLSSAGNLLVITDTRGAVVEAYNLDPDDFPQSEGIAFAPNGDMYISNEKKHGEPTLLRFPYLPKKQKK